MTGQERDNRFINKLLFGCGLQVRFTEAGDAHEYDTLTGDKGLKLAAITSDGWRLTMHGTYHLLNHCKGADLDALL